MYPEQRLRLGVKVIVGQAVFLLLIFSTGLTAQSCHRSGVSRKTIKVHFQSDFISLENEDKKWELSAVVTWERPNTAYEFSGYAVRAVKSKGNVLLSFTNCSVSGLQTTKSEFYRYAGLQFGYKYHFGVSLLHKFRPERQSKETYLKVETPDCYLETRDKEFCQGQSVEVSGVPLHFRLDCAAAATPEMTGESGYIVVLSWTRPIQVNGNITNYELRYWKSDLHLASSSAVSVEAHKDTVVHVLNDLLRSDYTAVVRTFVSGKGGGPRALLNFSTYDDQLNNNQNEICSELAENEVKTTFLPTTPKQLVSQTLNVGLLAGLLLAVVVTGCLLTICYIVKKRKNLAESKEAIFVRYSDDERRRKDSDTDKTFGVIQQPNVDFQNKEIDRSLLVISQKLGTGQFGIVYSGILNPRESLTKKNVPLQVAVKGLKLNATREMKEDFLDEIKLIIDIGNHPNILQMLGCCTVDGPYYLITEFMKYGDLLGFLWKCRDENYQAEDPIYCLAETGQLQIARQIVRGMEYLSNTRYYHGDLAARNVLVGEGLTVKISDFGMADDIYQRGYKRLGQEKKRPLKWVSLETNTKGACSIKSDVWSFGIVLYEIYTLGGVPYPGMDGFEVVRKLQDGYRMEQPDCCPDKIYIIMLECWHEKPDLRPTFTDLFNKLDYLLSDLSLEYFTAEPDFHDHFPNASESNTHGYENNKLLAHGSDNVGSCYDSLRAVGWKTVPLVTVECVDLDQ